jgi:hypothetical protein
MEEYVYSEQERAYAFLQSMHHYAALYHQGVARKAPVVKKVLCKDGKRRNVTCIRPGTSFLAVHASVRVGGKYVSGFIMVLNGDLEFVASRKSRNGCLLHS